MTKFSQNLCRKVSDGNDNCHKNEYKNFNNPYLGFNHSIFSESAHKLNKMIENTNGLTISRHSSDLIDDSSSMSSAASAEEHILAPLGCIGGRFEYHRYFDHICDLTFGIFFYYSKSLSFVYYWILSQISFHVLHDVTILIIKTDNLNFLKKRKE